nr:unnamed protein product [Digitaria exilis]
MDSHSLATGSGVCSEWAAPALKDLLPELSLEEQQRLENRGFRYRGRRKLKGRVNKAPPSPPPSMAQRIEGHKGGEFDAVKPLMEERVGFRGQIWFHLNFWARSRSTNKIKRFFAELHYKRSSDSNLIPIVEACMIIGTCTTKEPLSQYRTTCAFCHASSDILHPKGCRKFVCGNDKDRIGQRLVQLHGGLYNDLGM